MSISVVDRKLLWGRSANRCSWSGCDVRLTVNARSRETQVLSHHGVVLGEEAHIRSRKVDGPRHEPQYPKEDLDTYANLILLCPTHHTQIDSDGGIHWATPSVAAMKLEHENAVDRALSAPELRQRELDEHLAARLEVWWTILHLDSWEAISYGLNQPAPVLEDLDWRRLFDSGRWLQSLDWPAQYPLIARAFENHRRALWLLTICLTERMTNFDGSIHEVDAPHRRIGWNPELYNTLLAQRSVSCHAIWLLVIELTRSINLVISSVRTEFDALYRFADGVALMGSGDAFTGLVTVRLEYQVPPALLPAELSFTKLVDRMEAALTIGSSRGQAPVDLESINVAEWSRSTSS